MPLDPAIGLLIDPTVCPLCGTANQCAMETEAATGTVQPPCWCTALVLDAQVLARIPKASQGLACICAACAQGLNALPSTESL
jgi:Cysteine-rich CWC